MEWCKTNLRNVIGKGIYRWIIFINGNINRVSDTFRSRRGIDYPDRIYLLLALNSVSFSSLVRLSYPPLEIFSSILLISSCSFAFFRLYS